MTNTWASGPVLHRLWTLHFWQAGTATTQIGFHRASVFNSSSRGPAKTAPTAGPLPLSCRVSVPIGGRPMSNMSFVFALLSCSAFTAWAYFLLRDI
jgi:hypothetical protein